MQLARRLRLPAALCSVAVLACALISRPFAKTGVCDDGPYILVAQTLAKTGHILYNGWETPMLGAQLYLGAAFIKLFGFSFTAARMSTLLVAVVMAWVLQRTMVLAGVNERNATLGTLAFVLSPLYLMLSVTYMTDLTCLFGIVLCLYGCLRALQASTDRTTIAWLCFAVAANVICGTARQISWLGILIMVPSVLFLFRSRRRILLAGVLANLAGVLSAVVCELWFRRQPYTEPEHLVLHRGEEFNVLSSFFHTTLDLRFLLLPIVILFLPELLRDIRRSIKVAAAASMAYILILLVIHLRHAGIYPLLEPTLRDWVTRRDGFGGIYMEGKPPIVLHTGMRVLLTVASLGGLLGLCVSVLLPRPINSESGSPRTPSWKQLGVLLAPFTIAYTLLLVPRAASTSTVDGRILDRYLLELLVPALLCVLRYYQGQIHPRLPPATFLLVTITAAYGVASTHDFFATERACVKMAATLRAAGVPDTQVSYGWEYDTVTEIRTAGHINDPRILVPSHTYAPTPPLSAGTCVMYWHDETPHIHPIYGTAFHPNICYGPAPFAPVHYSRWLASTPGTLYVVRYLPTKA